MSVTVYIDILFITNFVINTCIFYISSIFLCRKIHPLSLILTGALLSLYSCIMFFPSLTFLFTTILKFIILSLCTLICFPTRTFKQVLKNSLTVFLTYAITGGIMYALIFLTDFGYKTNAAISNGEIYLNLSTPSLVISFFASIILTIVFLRIFKHSRIKEAQLYNVKIIYAGNCADIVVFGDTGCGVKDPLCGNTVMIVDEITVKKLIPTDFFETDKNASKWRIIPYSSISQKPGVLMGFVPDEIYINKKNHKNITVAISKTLLSPKGEYNGLINPNFICERIDENVKPAVT